MSDIKDFVWTDELVAEYSLQSNKLTLWDFKRMKLRNKQAIENYCERAKSKEKDIPKDKSWDRVEGNTNKDWKIVVGFGALVPEYLPYNYIESVLRLSDNETFTIGDDATVRMNDGSYYNFKIGKFYVEPYDNLMVEAGKTTYRYNIKLLEKVKPKVPLFTFEGFEVFENDIYWNVDDDFKCVFVYCVQKGWKEHMKRAFPTKEKAEQWVAENKPIEVSYKELHYNCSNYIDPSLPFTIQKVKEFFKSKINP